MNIQHNCKEELKEVALKATPARLAVLQLFEKAENPLDVSTIAQELENNKVKADQATVFRIINTFTNKGITKQLSFNEGKFRYELASKSDHHHLICEVCGRIDDISDCNIYQLEKDIQKKKNFHVRNHALEFFGVCKLCQS